MSLKYSILWDQITPIFLAAIILSFLFAEEYTLKIKQVIGITHLQKTNKQTNLISMGKKEFLFLSSGQIYKCIKPSKAPHSIEQHLREKYHY